MIVGIDEVGRGPWAGPVVFGAVVLGDANINGLTDSKKLSKKCREELDTEIRENAKAFGLGWVQADELDEVGLSEACKLACRRALEQIDVPYTQIILDGTVNFLKDTGKGPYVTTMKKADLLVPSVSAASIIAKVARDKYMHEQAENYPDYGFASHVGYGTATHLAALKQFGVTPIHRRSFAPIASVLGMEKVSKNIKKKATNATKTIGDKGEDMAASYLQEQGFTLVDRNWKTKWCEIDIVAEKDSRVYFVEVKYRRVPDQGGGIAAITPKKLKQMKLAAELWLLKHGPHDATLSIIEVTGEKYKVSKFVEQVQL